MLLSKEKKMKKIAALIFIISLTQQVVMSQNKNQETITLGAGCFWCTEAVFQRLKGVIKVESGYSGGKISNPTYKEVVSGLTGHAEVIQVTFDPTMISLEKILEVFWKTHDPTTLNRQGADVGTQYRSAVFYHNEIQLNTATRLKQLLNSEKIWDKPIVTEITKFEKFYKAEDYHQNYFNNNPNHGYCQFVIVPKLEKFEKLFSDQKK
jgi:peptide-methionine (S)-S-oxide reductase